MKPIRPALCLFAATSLALFLPAAEPPPAASPTETVITSQKVEMTSTKTETNAVFDGSVKLVGNNITVTCDHLNVVATGLGDKTAILTKLDSFNSLLATGHVRIVQGDREVTCGRAEIFPHEDKLVLTEEPVVFDHSGPYIITGDRLILLRGQRQIFGDNVKFSGPALKDLGFDKNQPMKAPAPVPATPPPAP